MRIKQYTQHDDVNAIVGTLLGSLKVILKADFVGMYLFGSLANGGFDEFSDVDALVVTRGEISESIFSALQAMHERIAISGSRWAAQLEVSYIPRDALRRFDRARILHPHIDRGKGERLRLMNHESDWIIQRHILRERGIVVAGPAPRTLIDVIRPDDLRQAVVDVLPLWVTPLLDDAIRQIRPRGYQSFIVLSLCRMLYTLKHGSIVSKSVAATWALKALDSKFSPLIERAIIGRQNSEMEVRPEDLNTTMELIRYTVDYSKGFDKPAPQATPFPEVNKILNMLLVEVKRILGHQFVGMYLYGSLSSGDFDLESSDIDFLVVTESILPDEAISALETFHKHTWASGMKWAPKLEGSYIPKDLIRRHDPAGPPCPTVNECRFFIDQRGSDWIIQRHVIREDGVVLEGPDPKTLIDFVTPDDIRRSVLGVLHEWWFPMLENPAWLSEHGSEYHGFAVISMCRVLHALEHGIIVSKPKAIEWARTSLEDPWKQLIDKAVAASRHEIQDDFLNEALRFIRYTMNMVKNNVSLSRKYLGTM